MQIDAAEVGVALLCIIGAGALVAFLYGGAFFRARAKRHAKVSRGKRDRSTHHNLFAGQAKPANPAPSQGTRRRRHGRSSSHRMIDICTKDPPQAPSGNSAT